MENVFDLAKIQLIHFLSLWSNQLYKEQLQPGSVYVWVGGCMHACVRACVRTNKATCGCLWQDGRTALHMACRGGHTDIVQALISAGTSVNKRTLVTLYIGVVLVWLHTSC